MRTWDDILVLAIPAGIHIIGTLITICIILRHGRMDN